MSWNEARAYAEWLSLRTGREYRLPTDAEWDRGAAGSPIGCFNVLGNLRGRLLRAERRRHLRHDGQSPGVDGQLLGHGLRSEGDARLLLAQRVLGGAGSPRTRDRPLMRDGGPPPAIAIF